MGTLRSEYGKSVLCAGGIANYIVERKFRWKWR